MAVNVQGSPLVIILSLVIEWIGQDINTRHSRQRAACGLVIWYATAEAMRYLLLLQLVLLSNIVIKPANNGRASHE